MRKVFISYARQNKPDVEQLVEHLRVLGCETWHDSSLHGGQDWWEEILQRIADCDTFIAIISRDALNSTACRREFDWAESLDKPVLPVAVEPPPKALPRRFSKRQIVDYSDRESRDRAALTLGGGLATLPSAPPPPDPLPERPAAPLSYLTDLIDLVTEGKALDHDQQRHILNQLEPALRSVDPEERRGGRDILELLSSRDDLYADVDRTINRLRDIEDGPASVSSNDPSTPKGPSMAVTAEPSTSAPGTIVGADVDSPEETRQRREHKPEDTHIDERAATYLEASDHSSASTETTPQRGVGTDTGLTQTASAPRGELAIDQPRADQVGQQAEAKLGPQAPTISEDSGGAVPATPPSTGIAPAEDQSASSGSGSTTATEDRGIASVPPTNTVSTAAGLPIFQRLNRHTKLVLAAGIVVAVVAVVVGIVVGTQSSLGGGRSSSGRGVSPTSWTVVSSGSAVLKGTFYFDLDTGTEGGHGPNFDIWWEQKTAVLRNIAPINGAQIVNLGSVNYDSLTPDALSSLTYSTTPIDGNNDASNKLVTGDVFGSRPPAAI